MKVNDKMMRKYVAINQNNNNNEEQTRSNSQAVLNINTTPEINIYSSK